MNNIPKQLESIITNLKTYRYIEESDVLRLQQCYYYLQNAYTQNETEIDHVLEHSIAVACHIASWRFNIDTVIAALFHDYSNNNFNQLDSLLSRSSINIISDYHKFKKILDVTATNSEIEQISKIDFTPSSIEPESVYIGIAERIDDLCRCKPEKSDNAIELANVTRQYLIPLVLDIHAYRLVDILDELCFQRENRTAYDAISSIVNESTLLNDYFRQQSLTKLKQIFDKDSNIIPKELGAERARIIDFIIDNRSIVSLHRFGIRNETSFEQALEKIANKIQTPYIDLTLLLKDDNNTSRRTSVHDVFFKYYSKMLIKENFYLKGFHSTTDNHSSYYIISDKMHNLYRLFVRTESEYLNYFYGDIIHEDNVPRKNISQPSEHTIKIFKPDGTSVRVNDNTTALDFAFLIHEDIGLHFDGGDINHNGKPVHPYTVLKNGDTVEIKKSKEVTAELRWFRYVKSELAINKLIKYFNSKLNQPIKEITVLTKDGTFAQIEANSTVLDFAFSIHPDIGLHFYSALVNGKKVPINYILQDQDKVIIRKSRQVRANISWFRYLNRKKSTNDLIKYFRTLE